MIQDSIILFVLCCNSISSGTTANKLNIWGFLFYTLVSLLKDFPYREFLNLKCTDLHGTSVQFSSVTQLCPTLQPHELPHTRPPCPSPTPRVHPNPCPFSQRCHPTISSCVIPFSSCPQSFPASGSFPVSQLLPLGGRNIGVSASVPVPPMNIQD